jgi:N6-adenosine-specific RNA methylase IME4
MSRYCTLVVDPPWSGFGAGPPCGREGFGDATGASRPMPYDTMTDGAIASMNISSIANEDAHLYLWTVNAKIEAAYDIVRAWGFKPSTLLTWAKNPMGGGLGSDAYGLSSEYILFARRGRLKPLSRVGRSWFNWKRPYDERGKPRHSAKPPEFYEMAAQVSPGPCIEVFARDYRAGWDAWGHEAPDDSAVLLRLIG